MQKILNLLKTFYIKYTNLKKEYWTHILIIFNYLFLFISLLILYFCISVLNNKQLFIGYFAFTILIYSFFLIFIIIIAFTSIFSKLKIIDNFLLHNKIYNIIWNLGNILSIIFIIFLVIFLLNSIK